MSDAQRDVLIRIKYETQNGKLAAPDIQQVKRAYEEVAKAREQAVGGDWRGLFKNEREAKDYAFSVYGPAGAGILKDDPEHIAAIKRIDDGLKQLGGTSEDFGKKAPAAFDRSLMGLTVFGRGLALVSANGSQDAQKLIQSLMQIQGAVDLIRGGGQILKMGPEVAAVTGIVTAGAVAWMAYHEQIVKAEAALKALNDEGRKFRQSEDRLRERQTAIGAAGTASVTDAALRPEERERRRAAEIREMQERQRTGAGRYEELDAASMRARGEVARAERESAAATLRESNAFWNPNPFVKPGEPGRQADEARRQQALADKARGSYEDLRKEQLGIGQQEETDATRRLDIERGRKDDRMAELDRWRAGAMQTALRPFGLQEDYIRRWGPQEEQGRRREEIENFNAGFATTARAFGMPLFTESQATGFHSSKANEVTREFEQAFTEMQQMIKRVQQRNAQLASEIQNISNAHSH